MCDCPYSDEKYASVQRHETYIIIGLGNGITDKPKAKKTLQDMACAGKGVYEQGTCAWHSFASSIRVPIGLIC